MGRGGRLILLFCHMFRLVLVMGAGPDQKSLSKCNEGGTA